VPSEQPRRFFIAVGVEKYISSEWENLEYVSSELASIVDLLSRPPFHLERVLETESKCPDENAFLTALSAWVKCADRHPDDHVVLYWSGHGAVAGGRLRLVLPNTTDLLSNAVTFDSVVEILLQEVARIGPVLVLLDVCYAGQGALDIGARLKDLTRERPRQSPPSIVALWATGSRHEADQLVFANAFVDAVQSAIDPDERLRPGLDIARIAERVAASLEKSNQYPGFWWSGSASGFNFLPNPHHIAHWPRGIDLATQRLFARLDPIARGVARAEEVGWFFKGRRRVFTDLCAWLKVGPNPGLCRVTGEVGAGKSAVLSRLYLLSRLDYRQQLSSQTLTETEMPPVGAIDSVVLLSNKTVPEVIADIARGLRISATTRNELVAALRHRDRCPVLLLDGLDEALAPKSTRDLLETLAQTTARVILGSRRPVLEGAGPAELDINLDISPWADHGAVESYLEQRLHDELKDCIAPISPWQQDLNGTARAVAKRARGNFLIARLTVTALIAGSSGDPRDPHWNFPKKVSDGFDLIFATLGDDEPRIRDLLLPLCYAQDRGLPRGQLWVAVANRLGPCRLTEAALARLFERAGHFIVEDLQESLPVYQPFHAAIGDHLRQGRSADWIHLQFADVMRGLLELESPDTSGDVAYARQTLARHLRLAGAWRELESLVVERSWIIRQSGRHPLDPAYYIRDINEAHAAAHSANLLAANTGQHLPALAPTVWCLLWRSALVSQVNDLPPSAWSLAVRVGAVPPASALRSAVSVGDEAVRAIRLVALAPVLRGHDLDELLDFAEGTKIPSLAVEKIADPHHAAADWYEHVLCAALNGPEAPRLTARALDAASHMKDYPRWLLLKASLPHVNQTQLTTVRQLIDDMRPDHLGGWWHALAVAAYLSERAQRGDEGAVREAIALPQNTLTWWFTIAALFSLRRDGVCVDLGSLSLLRELRRAEEEVEDWLQRLEVMTALVRALPDLVTPAHRAAFAAYLRLLHSYDLLGRNARVRLAGCAGECLPPPHGMRLLRWAKASLTHPTLHDRVNINWYHTPPRLAVAFARSGDLAGALDTVRYAWNDPYFRPMATIDVVASFNPEATDDRHRELTVVVAGAAGLSRDERLQFLSAAYDLLDRDQRTGTIQLLDAHRLSMGGELPVLRCGVLAAVARHTRLSDTDYRTFARLVASAPECERDAMFANLAETCANGGHADLALDALVAINSDWARASAWARALAVSSEPTITLLLPAFAKDDQVLRQFTDGMSGLDCILGVVARMSADLLLLVETFAALGDRPRVVILATVAVRAFELGVIELSARALSHCPNILVILATCHRLPVDDRRRFIKLVERVRAPSGFQNSDAPAVLLVDILCAPQPDAQIDIDAVVDIVKTDEDGWVLHLLSPVSRLLVISKLFKTRVREDLVHHGALEFYGWLIPWLDAEQIEHLLEMAGTADDDYRRDEAIVTLLPRFAELHGCEAALQLRQRVGRYDFQAASWAALWPFLADGERAQVFELMMTSDVHPEGSHEATALCKIAPLLKPRELLVATKWIVTHHGGARAGLVGPLIDAACLLPPREGYDIWDCIVTELARLPIGDAAAYLCELVPLVEHLGGADALRAVAHSLERAAEQWT
jgi:hypothetical protein